MFTKKSKLTQSVSDYVRGDKYSAYSRPNQSPSEYMQGYKGFGKNA